MGKEVPTTTENTVETEVSEQENSKTPIYKSEKVDIIEPSLDTNLSQMETTKTTQTNQSLIEDVKGMKV
jgi:acetamidase/formamidase